MDAEIVLAEFGEMERRLLDDDGGRVATRSRRVAATVLGRL
ncbi:hypothetical protein [Nonomuraea sp. NPDC046570]